MSGIFTQAAAPVRPRVRDPSSRVRRYGTPGDLGLIARVRRRAQAGNGPPRPDAGLQGEMHRN